MNTDNQNELLRNLRKLNSQLTQLISISKQRIEKLKDIKAAFEEPGTKIDVPSHLLYYAEKYFN